MSLYGALYSSVSGIQAQSTAIGIISDNVSNVNTIGYKAGSHYFSTLVTNSGAGAAYSPGGVRAQNRQLISQQGLVQSSNSPLDIAVSGNGFFVVQDAVNEADNPTTMYTRAGSFRKDSLGNFVNAAGLFLKAWPLDQDGDIPSNFASPDSLQLVNIGSASGNAAATTKVDMGINLKADATRFKGSGLTLSPGSESGTTENSGTTASDILIPNANLTAGDIITVNTDGTDNDYDFEYGGFETSVTLSIGSPILTAADSDDIFDAVDDDSFTITRSADTQNPITLTFRSSGIDANEGTFNSLDTLAAAINAQDGFNARVVDNTLYVSAADAREEITFANVTGSTNDFVTLLDLDDVASSTSLRFNTLEGLSELVNNNTLGGLKATLNNPTTDEASIEIYNSDPLTDITISDDTVAGTLLQEFGLTPSSGDPTTTDAVSPSYDVSNEDTAMFSGAVEPHFQRSFRIYDSLGTGHDVNIAFLKVDENNWRAEIYTQDGEVSGTTNLIASGSVRFNGDGTLASVSSSLTTDVTFRWANEARSSVIDINLGTAGGLGSGQADGLRQFAGTNNVFFITQNGAEAGLLDSVSIDKAGYIVANFNNGQTQRLYKIPLADFTNPDGLQTRNGNAFIQSFGSGAVNLKEAGTGGVGSISPSSLEASGAELSEELTDMIVAQRAYQASAKVITTADELLEALNRISG